MYSNKATAYIPEVGTSSENRHLTFTSKCGRTVLQMTQWWLSTPHGANFNQLPLPGRMNWPCPCTANKELCHFTRVTNPTLKVFGAHQKKK